jgi:SAM-dependent methyltransferase
VKLKLIEPPRVFATGRGAPIAIKDCARIELAANEQVTFTTENGSEYDVARKSWGFYATPSINGRLLDFNLRTVLVKSFVGKYYIFLVERGREGELQSYLESERNAIVRWLDNSDDLRDIEHPALGSAERGPPLHCMCGADRFTSVHTYFEPPPGEVRFPFSAGDYRRELFRCSLCRHYVSVHQMDTSALYSAAYVDATYGNEEGLRRTFERIMALPPERSDNAGRVRRINDFFEGWRREADAERSVLDVGSGLCVFLARMKGTGWRCTALDPDPRAARHARETVGIEAFSADWMGASGVGRYQLIAFNKVLEHVPDPVAMLARSRDHLVPGGVVYIELPDGEAAAPPRGDGFGREEFFIEHHHVFSMASLGLLAERAGLSPVVIERLREPSSKYTLRAFLAP